MQTQPPVPPCGHCAQEAEYPDGHALAIVGLPTLRCQVVRSEPDPSGQGEVPADTNVDRNGYPSLNDVHWIQVVGDEAFHVELMFQPSAVKVLSDLISAVVLPGVTTEAKSEFA